MAFRDNPAKLSSLAGEKAMIDRGTTAFSAERAMEFLKRVPGPSLMEGTTAAKKVTAQRLRKLSGGR